MEKWGDWAFWLLIVLVGLTFMAGTPVESQPLITGAATLLTIPLSIVGALMATGWGLLLAPLLFVLVAYYLKTLHYYLGTEVIYFVAFAALLLAFVANPR